MFFFKKNETAKPERFVVVLGTSPLAIATKLKILLSLANLL